jgi:hypothetical protein
MSIRGGTTTRPSVIMVDMQAGAEVWNDRLKIVHHHSGAQKQMTKISSTPP